MTRLLIVALASLLTSGCAHHAAENEGQTSSSASTLVAWEQCLVPISGDSSLRDLPPFPYRDPGPTGITVSGSAARRAGPIKNEPAMTLSDALMTARVDPSTPVVVWRCEDKKLHALRLRPDAPLQAHDWVVAPDPASIY